jgi:selenocysteine lyase/cysteine desulfurase
MKPDEFTKYRPLGFNDPLEFDNSSSGNIGQADAFTELERGIYASLEVYSNVHRGSGHNSIVTTFLFEKARETVLKYMGLNRDRYVVIFCTPVRASALMDLMVSGSYQNISSRDIGLPLGLVALAARRKALPKGVPFQTGGGTTRLVSPGWIIWAGTPYKFEAGTPAIINIIAFARALKLISHLGEGAFDISNARRLTVAEILQKDELEGYSGRKLLEEFRKTLIGRNVLVPTMDGAKPFINLDNGASTPTFEPIWNAFRNTLSQSKEIRQEVINEVKSICSEMLGAPLAEYDVIFTTNTTEAINLAAQRLSCENDTETESIVLNTLLEHNSNDLPWRMYRNFSLVRMTVDTDGFLDLNELNTILSDYNQKGIHGRKRIKLVAVSGASNVLGSFNDLEVISRIVHQYNARLLVDAAQLVAHRRVQMEKYGIDYLAFSAHKVYAPFGIGVLVVRKGLLSYSQEELNLINSSGEENAGGIAALGKAMLILKKIGLDLIQEEERALTEHILNGLSEIKGIRIYGIKDPESPLFERKGGVIAFNFRNKLPEKVAKILTERGGIGVRGGCHCAHLLVKHLVGVPPFLEQFQGFLLRLFPKLNLPGILRVSLGIENTEEEIDTFINVMKEIAKKDPGSNKTTAISAGLKKSSHEVKVK